MREMMGQITKEKHRCLHNRVEKTDYSSIGKNESIWLFHTLGKKIFRWFQALNLRNKIIKW